MCRSFRRDQRLGAFPSPSADRIRHGTAGDGSNLMLSPLPPVSGTRIEQVHRGLTLCNQRSWFSVQTDCAQASVSDVVSGLKRIPLVIAISCMVLHCAGPPAVWYPPPLRSGTPYRRTRKKKRAQHCRSRTRARRRGSCVVVWRCAGSVVALRIWQ